MSNYSAKITSKEQLCNVLRVLQMRLKLNEGELSLAEMLIHKTELDDWQRDTGPIVCVYSRELNAFTLSSKAHFPMDLSGLLRAQIVLPTQEITDYLRDGRFDQVIAIDLTVLRKNFSKYLRQARQYSKWSLLEAKRRLQDC